jgi:predicted dienelactone hydrolase
MPPACIYSPPVSENHPFIGKHGSVALAASTLTTSMSFAIKFKGPAQRLFPRCRLLLLVFFLEVFFAEPATATNPVLWGGLELGSYKVGFTVLRLKDPSRSFGSSSSRPIQVSLWYPVVQKTSTAKPRMPFSGYVALYMTPVSSDRVLTSRDRTAAFDRYRKEWFPKEKQSDVARLLHTPTFCLRDAPPAEGHFPLVIYAPGYGAIPLTHTSTAEYLASHGYVVAMSPSRVSRRLE